MNTQKKSIGHKTIALILLVLPVVIPFAQFLSLAFRLQWQLRYGVGSTLTTLLLQSLPFIIAWLGILRHARWTRNMIWLLVPYAFTLTLFSSTWLYYIFSLGLVSLSLGIPVVISSSLFYAIVVFLGCMYARKIPGTNL